MVLDGACLSWQETDKCTGTYKEPQAIGGGSGDGDNSASSMALSGAAVVVGAVAALMQ